MRCEKGDLAKIIYSVWPANLGKIVMVESYIGHFKEGESFDYLEVPCKAPVTDHFWWITAEYGISNGYGETPKAYIADTWLEPLRPLTLKEVEESEEIMSV